MIGGHPSCVAEVIHEGIASPAKSVLDGHGIRTCFMKSHASTDANGVGSPSSQVIGSSDSMGDFGSLLEPRADVFVGDEVGVLHISCEDGQWQRWVMLEIGCASENPFDGKVRTTSRTSWNSVEMDLLTILIILLISPGDGESLGCI